METEKSAIEKLCDWLGREIDDNYMLKCEDIYKEARRLAAEEKAKPAPVEANKCEKCASRNPGRPDRKKGNCHKCFFQDSWTWDREEYCDPSNCPRLTGNFNCEEKP